MNYLLCTRAIYGYNEYKRGAQRMYGNRSAERRRNTGAEAEKKADHRPERCNLKSTLHTTGWVV